MFREAKARLRLNHPMYRIFRHLRNRWQILRYGVKRVHPTFYISPGCKISKDLEAQEFGFLGDGCRICPKVSVGKYVMFGPQVAIIGADHVFDRPGTPIIFSGRPVLERTSIEDDVWVGFGAIIIAGVHIGRGAIVAAGAVVTCNVPGYEIYGGIPARKIGVRFAQAEERLMHDMMLDMPPREGRYCLPREGEFNVWK